MPMVWKRCFLLNMAIFRIYVIFLGVYVRCTFLKKGGGHDNFSGGFTNSIHKKDFWMVICEGFLDSKCAKN